MVKSPLNNSTCKAEHVIAEEKKYLPETKNLFGLAISGGGIRSASFGLGVMQALVGEKDCNVLKEIDYLSTVSGGGYIGSALTWFLTKKLPDGQSAGTDAGNFPLGKKWSGARTENDSNLILNFIRQHSNYLLPGKGLNTLSLFGIVIRSIFISLFVYMSLLTIIFTGIELVIQLPIVRPLYINPMLVPLFIVGLIILFGYVFSIRTYFIKGKNNYKSFVESQKRTGIAWAITLGLLLVASLPAVYEILNEVWMKISTVGLLTIISYVTGAFEKQAQQKSKSKKGSKSSTLRLIIGATAIVYALLYSGYSLGKIVSSFGFLFFVGLIVFTLLIGFFVNLNYAGFHRMYRNRLMETFMPNMSNILANEWGLAMDADDTLLKDMCTEKNKSGAVCAKRPYHLINTNIVLIDSPTTKFRGRGGDSFLLSPLFCGSDATGYCSTTEYNTNKRNRGITLATAMAISGAAANPDTGCSGKGITRNRLISLLMGILNLRLGYWAINPNFEKPFHLSPNFLFPGLKGNVIGSGLNENNKYIELTDGGHFENLGIYELIRRKTKLIIVSDAGADPDYQFGDLANAVERVRVDFGVKIRFGEKYGRKTYDINDILPGSAKKDDFSKKYNLAKRGFAIAKIIYPGEPKEKNGILIYIKSTLINGLPADIYGYKSAHTEFPDETTADQFFNEEQFEAYRELGYQLAWHVVDFIKKNKIMEGFERGNT